MHAFGHGEIRVSGVVANQLLLESDICRIDSWIGVVLTKHGNTSELERERLRRYGHSSGISWRRRCRVGICGVEERAGSDFLLLDAVGGDGADLGEHVLTRE